jgi:hypothetical protein
MMEDSRADLMTIFFGDLVLLQNMEATATGAAPSALPSVCRSYQLPNSDKCESASYIRMVQAALFADDNGDVMTNPGQEWDLIQCIIRDGYQPDLDDDRITGL